ncbi:MAG: zinc-ribbon domain-containing protein [Patescibacteria group bacterium]
MALIKCSECGKDVSDKAVSCPFCGNPIAPSTAPTTPASAPEIVTIQQTKKSWKLLWLVSVILLLIGLGQLGGNAPIGWMCIFFAVVLFVISKIGAWWTNA